jgi:hypothetical protein
MLDETTFNHPGLNAMETVVFWFSDPKRILFHLVSRIARALVVPILHLVLAIIVKRLFGLNKPGAATDYTQIQLLRRFINGSLLSRHKLATAFAILGNHYEIVSVCFLFLFHSYNIR